MQLTCPNGSLGAAYTLSDGTLSVIVVQPELSPPSWTLPDGSVRAQARSPEGRTVVVVSEPDPAGGAAPYSAELQAAAQDVSGRY